jgi:hypothetical protein
MRRITVITSQTSLFDIAKIQIELTNLLGINVDVLTPRALPDKLRKLLSQTLDYY